MGVVLAILICLYTYIVGCVYSMFYLHRMHTLKYIYHAYVFGVGYPHPYRIELQTIERRKHHKKHPQQRAKRCCVIKRLSSLFGRETEVVVVALKTKSCLSKASSFCLAETTAGVVQKVQT